MRVFEYKTKKVFEIGLFDDLYWKPDMKIRLLEIPLAFGERGEVIGCLEVREKGESGGTRYSLDPDAITAFELDQFEGFYPSPQAALQALVRLTPRFAAEASTS